MFKKLKLADYIIIFFVCIAIAICGLKLFGKKNFSNLPIEKETKIMFEVFFRGVTLTSKEVPFKVDDNAFITIRNVPYAKLKIVSVDGSPRMAYFNDGKKSVIAQDVSMPNLYDFVVRLEDNAKKTPDGYVAGGNKIKMGIPVVIEGELYKYQGTISNIFEVQGLDDTGK